MKKAIYSFISACMFFGVIIMVLLISTFWKYSLDLPDYKVLEKYEPAVTTRLFAGDGQLLMEYAFEKRLFVPVEKIPDRVKQAFLSAEDKNFYAHSGVDYTGVLRAILGNLKNLGSGRRPTGASTITQQVAKNFLLSSELSYIRKIKEAILAYRIEDSFTKDHILELYLNEIYLGNRAYGVAAAAINYFGKSLNDLTLEEAAYLAALPKGPNNYNPKTRYEAAVARRNWVIKRMFEDGYVTDLELAEAVEMPLETIDRSSSFIKDAEYFSEEVRREIVDKFGDDALYEGGLIVRTTVDPKLQEIASKALRRNLEAYDIRHGYRGAVANIAFDDNEWRDAFDGVEMPKGAPLNWEKAVVMDVKEAEAEIETESGGRGEVPFALLSWARKTLPGQKLSDPPAKITEVLAKGDVVYVEKLNDNKDKEKKDPTYQLRQVPNVEGAVVVIDPHTGKVLAAVGGYSFAKSQYNRATQARRQTGSAFKPVVYLAALENGYSPTDLILDAPFVAEQGKGLPKWKPVNYGSKFYGLTTLRQGIEKSRNLMTVRLAQDMGMDKVVDMASRLDVTQSLPALLSMSLGAGETRPINITNAYAM
ncbi:MAG: transglycosylase domain-containing protein, partial [Lactobacillus sp.]|nr:transglycosylase domain-containing protein [Lactobacillus sp.]